MSDRRLRRPLGWVALGAALLAGLAWFVLGRGDGGGYAVEAEFADVRGLRDGSEVKVGGVPAGSVAAIEVTDRDTAIVRMELDAGAVPLGQGATAHVRPVNLLGETYLDLDPGDQRRPAAPGARIPRSRTGAPVELDDLLNTLDPDTRALLRILIGEAGAALGGRGSDLGALLEELPPSLDALQSLLAEVEGETRTLRALLDDGDRLLAALAPRRDDLGELVDVAGTALTATASRRRELGEAVAEAPAALRRLRGTLAELGTTAQALGPTARALREASPPLARTLDALPAFAADASGTLSAARRAAPALRRLGAAGAPVVRRLRPTAQELVRFTDVLVPVAAMLDRDGARRLLAVADYLGKVKQSSDGLGHLFRLHAVLDRDLVASALERYGGDQALDFLLGP